MTPHIYYFAQLGAKLTHPYRRALEIQTPVPLERLCKEKVPYINVARWSRGGWEYHGDISQDHRGISEARLLYCWDGVGAQVPNDVRYFPFVAIPDCPGEFRAISLVESSKRLDRIVFSEAADEITLYRLNPYDPHNPGIIRFKLEPSFNV
ncbi:MAG: hypothetical protein WAO98_03705 [Alphaproteobacteria bacterium]